MNSLCDRHALEQAPSHPVCAVWIHLHCGRLQTSQSWMSAAVAGSCLRWVRKLSASDSFLLQKRRMKIFLFFPPSQKDVAFALICLGAFSLYLLWVATMYLQSLEHQSLGPPATRACSDLTRSSPCDPMAAPHQVR